MIYDNIVAYCKTEGISILVFEQLCGLSNGTVGKWEGGKLQPSLGSLQKIESATGVSIAAWLSKEAVK